MNRSKLREKVFRLVFRVAFNDREELEQQTELFFGDEEQEGMTEKEQKQVQDKFDGVVAHLTEIDEMINEKSTGWNVSRLGKVELAILRLAIYEIVYDDNIPGSVAINEAVELAKQYAADESPAFVNAVLAKFMPKEEK
jgi:N utilization substance protein B